MTNAGQVPNAPDTLAALRAKSLVQIDAVLRVGFFAIAPGALSPDPATVQWGIPFNFRGGAGVGKSSVLKAFGMKWDVHCEVLSPALQGEGKFGAIPVYQDGHITYPPQQVASLVRPAGMIVVDEITSTPVALEPYCLGLVLDRKLGDTYLGDRVRTFAACNPSHMAANGRDLSLPMNARMGWVEWPTPTPGEFANRPKATVRREEVVANSIESEEARVLAAWPKAYAVEDALVQAFLKRFPEWLYKEPDVNQPQVSPAWPCPRTWDFAVSARASGRCQSADRDTMDLVTQAFVGPAAFEALSVFVDQMDMGDPEEYVDGKIEFKWDSRRIDRGAATVGACVAFTINDQAANAATKQARADRIAGWLDNVPEKDVTVPAIQALVKANLHLSKVMIKLLTKYKPALVAAGLKAGDVLS
jgi:hypothetical protein